MNMRKVETIEQELKRQYGALIGAPALSRLLGYPTANALHQASRRGRLGIRLFPIAHRRGQFAFTADVAQWLHRLRYPDTKQTDSGKTEA